MRLQQFRRGAGLAMLAAAVLLAGCAVQPNGRGGVVVGMDSAQLFGTTLSTFQLQNGTEGALRREPNNGAFSIKLNGTMRVVPLPNAVTARVARVLPMGTRTVLVVETQERNCPYKYEVLSIDGTDVLHWSLGNCNDRPRVFLAEGGQALYFDFPGYDRLQRNIYTDSRMLNAGAIPANGVDVKARPFADANLNPPPGAAQGWQTPGQGAPQSGTAQRSTPAGAPAADSSRVIPAPPHKAGGIAASPAPAAAAPPAAAAAPAAASQPAPRRSASNASGGAAARAATPAPMSFPAQEVAPIHLDLRK